MLDFLESGKDLTNLSSFHTKATASYYFEVSSEEDLEKLPKIVAFAKENSLPYVMIGGGSNILFAFENYPGIIIRSVIKWYSVDDTILTVGSGELVSPLAIKIEKEFGNKKLLPWIGLPGTFWGAIVGNAGCFGLEASQMVKSIKVFDIEKGAMLTFFQEELEYEYRHSMLKHTNHYFIVSAELDITPPSEDPIDARLHRKDKQPGGWSCGSFFKNPPGNSAWKLIDQAGLKWTRIGGIRVSEMHGNFFLNDGTATHKDVLELKDLVKKTVLEKFQIELEEEVKIISQP